MLTQCPECKTTFRLHVNQLQAAGGKVRCSRCNATFDALDNLFEPAPVAGEAPATPAPEPTPQTHSIPESKPEQGIDTDEPVQAEAGTPDDAKERITSIFDEPEEASAPAAEEQDTLDAFIGELEEATTSLDEEPLPPIDEESPAEEHAPQPPLGDEMPDEGGILSAALDSIDGNPTESSSDESVTLSLADAEEALEATDEETVEEVINLEAPEEELLPLVEPEETLEAAVEETFEEAISLEAPEEELLPLVEPEETLEAAVEETFEEAISLEAPEEELLPRVEPEESLETAVGETIDEALSIEPLEEEIRVEPIIVEEGIDSFFEETEPEVTKAPAAEDEPEAESLVSEEELDSFFEETEPEVTEAPAAEDEPEAESLVSEEELDSFFEETEPEVTEAPAAEDEPEAESLVSEEELDSFFEEAEPEVTEAPAVEDEPEAESLVSEEELDSFFEESETETTEEPTATESAEEEEQPEQGDLLDILEEPQGETEEEAAMDEFQLPEEPVAAKPPSDPRDPFSEEQIESMLSPNGEQAIGEVAARQSREQSADALDLDTGGEAIEQQAATEEERQPSSEVPVGAAAGYAIPAELTQVKQGSGAVAVLWGLGIILMCAGLALQYLYYHRMQLVENPQLRPLLSTMCSVTGCELPPRRDLGHIELTEHLMQFHPNYEQSLLITATLANRADFAQPYPLVEVIMTDTEQQVVARRRFPPEQYLQNTGGDNFPANSEVPLMLEVLDPGNRAIGFEFRFY